MHALRFTFRLLILPALAAFYTCQDTNSPSAADETAFPLTVVYATALRESPSEKSAELDQLPFGTRLRDEGQVSDFLASVSLRDTLRQEPWMKVQTLAGRTGWVFAGALRPPSADSGQLRAWVLDKRFQALFGPVLAQRWRVWSCLPAPVTDTAFSVQLREGLSLRDTLNLLIGRVLTRDAASALPDLYWLSELSPYFVVQQTANGSLYTLFLDFRTVARTAAHTTGRQDDLLGQLGFTAYPADSIESVLPVWVFPLNTEESCSNLGQGQHLRLLRAIDAAQRSGDLFRPELEAMKDRILNDILDRSRDYWQPKEKILQELAAILRERPRCLNDRDVLALEARQNMFAAPEANGIRVNVRTGN